MYLRAIKEVVGVHEGAFDQPFQSKDVGLEGASAFPLVRRLLCVEELDESDRLRLDSEVVPFLLSLAAASSMS